MCLNDRLINKGQSNEAIGGALSGLAATLNALAWLSRPGHSRAFSGLPLGLRRTFLVLWPGFSGQGTLWKGLHSDDFSGRSQGFRWPFCGTTLQDSFRALSGFRRTFFGLSWVVLWEGKRATTFTGPLWPLCLRALSGLPQGFLQQKKLLRLSSLYILESFFIERMMKKSIRAFTGLRRGLNIYILYKYTYLD